MKKIKSTIMDIRLQDINKKVLEPTVLVLSDILQSIVLLDRVA